MLVNPLARALLELVSKPRGVPRLESHVFVEVRQLRAVALSEAQHKLGVVVSRLFKGRCVGQQPALGEQRTDAVHAFRVAQGGHGRGGGGGK